MGFSPTGGITRLGGFFRGLSADGLFYFASAVTAALPLFLYVTLKNRFDLPLNEAVRTRC